MVYVYDPAILINVICANKNFVGKRFGTFGRNNLINRCIEKFAWQIYSRRRFFARKKIWQKAEDVENCIWFYCEWRWQIPLRGRRQLSGWPAELEGGVRVPRKYGRLQFWSSLTISGTNSEPKHQVKRISDISLRNPVLTFVKFRKNGALTFCLFLTAYFVFNDHTLLH